MRIFRNKKFTRFADNGGITDDQLKNAVAEIEAGKFDADLGGGVFKQRVARKGQGKSGGFRTILLYKSDFRAFFVHGFAKSDMANIKPNELEDFRDLAKSEFLQTDEQLEKRLAAGTLIEIM